MSRRESVFWWALIVATVSSPAWCGEPVARLAGPAGTMCEKGERYEAVRIFEGDRARWKALCYRDVDLEEARRLVAADTSLPSSEGRSGPCMTCPTPRERLEVDALVIIEDLYWRRGWYHGGGRWRRE